MRGLYYLKKQKTMIKRMILMKTTLNVREAAEMCGVCTSTIYDMARAEEIPHVRVRNRIIFHREVLDQWLRSGGNEILEG
jgi:excisionase family DNA binding protein